MQNGGNIQNNVEEIIYSKVLHSITNLGDEKKLYHRIEFVYTVKGKWKYDWLKHKWEDHRSPGL